ncbi:MAG TPA: hypothetical protein VGR87_06380 [Candidatus Limnocylindria bacterium]|jgi:hypothetical protein|nr:hypothetical protein [Candidatus Limnocylindria bacterium]
MDAMNTFDRTQPTSEYRPILRRQAEDWLPSQQAECTCPELCQIDHDN